MISLVAKSSPSIVFSTNIVFLGTNHAVSLQVNVQIIFYKKCAAKTYRTVVMLAQINVF